MENNEYGRYLGELATGEVVYDAVDSHLAVHKVPDELLKAALNIIPGVDDLQTVPVDFNRVIGNSSLVETGPDDDIIYAKRPNRFGFTRFVKNRESAPTRFLTVIMKRGDRGGYILITAFLGEMAPPEPWDKVLWERGVDALQEATDFWHNHALVWGDQETLEGTETEICPW